MKLLNRQINARLMDQGALRVMIARGREKWTKGVGLAGIEPESRQQLARTEV
jgi:hypothetical protein